MLVLAIDTATPYLVLGLPQAERALRLERRHAEVLWAELEDFLASNNLSKQALEGIAVGRGPGSYTGLRVGIAAGLGLARGLGIPLVGVDTLAGVAMRYSKTVSVAHTTRNGLCYAAKYSVQSANVRAIVNPYRSKLSELEPQGLFSLDEPPSGLALVQLGQKALQAGQLGVEALYL